MPSSNIAYIRNSKFLEQSDLSIFAVENLEKLLISQYKLEKDRRFNVWLRKMNDLDFRNCTRTFFSEIRSRLVLK